MHFKVFRNIKYFSSIYKSEKIVPLLPILKKWENTYQSLDIDGFEFDLKCMVAHIFNEDFKSFDKGRLKTLLLTRDQFQTLEKLCECRLARVPIQYILGEWDFYGLNLKMQPTVFIPRPETEGLVNLAIKDLRNQNPTKFLEIGSGTGAICLSILKSIATTNGVAIDRSRLACKLTTENAVMLEVQDRLEVLHHIVSSDGLIPKEISNEKFDMIISNPPYIRSSDIPELPPEITLYENLNALDGGVDGLKIAKLIIQIANLNLKKNGKLWIELDPKQLKIIKKIISAIYPNDLKYVGSSMDVFKKERFAEIKKLT